MKQVLIRQGQAVVDEIPAPQAEAGTVLVRVDHSCISIGTEMSGIKSSGAPLWKKALQHPEKVKKVFEMVANQGIKKTKSLVEGKMSIGNPIGYSAAGVIVEIGEGIEDLRPGDRVACAGAQCAHHAEYICVPRNLTVPVPEKVDFASASTVTLGAIAMQGVRRASPTLGETFVVIGLGILGQITSQLLKANGCRVLGTDLDANRIELAHRLGMDLGIDPSQTIDIEEVICLTDGLGADGVIITAATPSDAVISTAFKMCRKKGRVVLVGDVGLCLNRGDFYQKELDFFISSSYGPGRYDNRYEEKGLDYPVAYVRWTENRNMMEYLRLLAEGKVAVKPLISETYPIDMAPEAYATLKGSDNKPLMVLLSYPQRKEVQGIQRKVINSVASPAGEGRIRLALVGAGGFAKGMHLPNMQQLSDLYHLQAVVSRTGHNAMATAQQFAANYSTTDYQEVLQDPDIETVLIATRHNVHANIALQALQAGKHVLVEKPLALTRNELDAITDFYNSKQENATVPVLLTGFNRRFSVYAKRVQEITKSRTNPLVINYRMNAGYIPLDHWVHGEEGGGRNRGEACHIYDLFTYLVNSKATNVQVSHIKPKTNYYSLSDNFIATITFEDGSIATLMYTAMGSKEYPKESMEVYVDGKTIVLDDYKRLNIFGSKQSGIDNRIADKGQKDELIALAHTIRKGGDWPIPLWQQIQATEISFLVEEQLGGAV